MVRSADAAVLTSIALANYNFEALINFWPTNAEREVHITITSLSYFHISKGVVLFDNQEHIMN
jgi:hypothetical protein